MNDLKDAIAHGLKALALAKPKGANMAGKTESYEIYILSDASRLDPATYPDEYRREDITPFRHFPTKEAARVEARDRKAIDGVERLIVRTDMSRPSYGYRPKRRAT